MFDALLSAVFAALTAIFAKVGIKGVDTDLATAIRTAHGNGSVKTYTVTVSRADGGCQIGIYPFYPNLGKNCGKRRKHRR